MENYYYRKHIKLFRNFGSILTGILAIIFWLLTFVLIFFSSDGFDELSLITTVLALILTIESFLTWYFLGRFMKIRFSIDNEQIIYKNYKSETVIKFEEIDKLKFSFIPYIGGWIKIISKNETIRLTVVIKDIHKLLMSTKEALDKKNMNNVYSDKAYNTFLKTAVYADDSWERLYKIWWKLLLFTIAATIIGTILGGLSFSYFLNTFLLGLFSYFYPTIIYVITEVIFIMKIRQLSKEDIKLIFTRNIAYEKNIYKKAILYSFLFYIVLATLLMFI
ncbi:MAG: hypothetical protein ACOWWH_05115 [Eubacteriaceae bacterium]